ncbi:hypothetical protein FA95DRAFT_1667924, partial [Auriscalpium vulgare]
SVHSSRRASQNNARTRVSTLRRAASWQHTAAQPRRARSDHSPHHAGAASHVGGKKHSRALHMEEAPSLMPGGAAADGAAKPAQVQERGERAGHPPYEDGMLADSYASTAASTTRQQRRVRGGRDEQQPDEVVVSPSLPPSFLL